MEPVTRTVFRGTVRSLLHSLTCSMVATPFQTCLHGHVSSTHARPIPSAIFADSCGCLLTECKRIHARPSCTPAPEL